MDMTMWINALKAARASAGVSQDALAELIPWSASTIAAIETGRRKPTMRFAGAADTALNTGGYLTELLEYAEKKRSPWWFTPWRRYEEDTLRLRTFQPSVVPGLLQTEAYAREVITAGNLHSPAKAEELIQVRLERQQLLTRDDPPDLVFVMDESVFLHPIGGRAVLDAQVRHIQELATRPRLRVHVIPLEAGAHVGYGGGFALADLTDGEQVGYLENVARGEVADDLETIDLLRRKWDSLLGEAASLSASLDSLEKYKLVV